MATQRLKELHSVESFDFATMEAELRLAPSEEIKGWIAEERQNKKAGVGAKKRPDWDDGKGEESDDSAVFMPE